MLYHNEFFGDDSLQNDFNAVVPCHQMLKKALKLDQVHTFGDISKSQVVEKLDLMIEIALFNQLNSSQPNSQTLIVIISLAGLGLLAESD